MPLLFFLSSIVAGLAMVIAGATISYWVFKRSLDQKLVGGLARIVPWVLAVYLAVRLGDLFLAGKAGLLFTSGGYSAAVPGGTVHRVCSAGHPLLAQACPREPRPIPRGRRKPVAGNLHEPL